MNKWVEYKLSELAEIVPGYAFKSNEFIRFGVPVIKIKDINTPYVTIHDNCKVDEKKFSLNNMERYTLSYGDFVVAMTGATIGKVGRLREDVKAFINQRVAKIVVNSDIANDLFVYYCVVSKFFQNYIINNIDSNSAQENISGDSIGRFPIRLPSLEEQRAIASILSSLDDKIDLLHRQNETLEQIAETLFRQWFIEEAQDDWEEVYVDNIVEISSGKSLNRRFFNDAGEYPVFGANGIIGRTNKFLLDKKVIFSGRVGTLGKVFINNGKAWLSDNTLIFLPRKYFYFSYFVLKSAGLEYYDVGSTQPLIRQSDIKNIKITIPDNVQLQFFEDISDLIFCKVEANERQKKQLHSLRETLLPKLISGEVKIKTINH